MRSRHFVFIVFGVLVGFWSSCDSHRSAEAQTLSSFQSASSRSAYWETPVGEPAMAGGLIVRPDVLLVAFTFRRESESLAQALPELKQAVERYVSAATGALKAEPTVRMGNLGGELRKMGEQRVVVSGVLEVALPESLDFWGRAALVAALAEVGAKESATLEKAEGPLRASFSDPRAQLREPEAYRAELMKRWVARTRDFIEQARSERTALQFVHCDPPDEVKQQTRSLDEVSLSLEIPRCQLGLAAP
jgi:hypothetical protein